MKPSIPKGTRDFTPEEMARRNYIFDTIRSVFRLYGFRQIETPALENLSTLMGKYGEEGDKLLFKILNSGDWKAPLTADKLDTLSSNQLTSSVSEKGLRYDLTVPFARFVVQNRDKIQFPFKRYQIQPVWRADRPQKGRYREFYQCDADVVGTDSLLSELELIRIIEEVYRRLGIRVCLKINNRKILAGLAEVIGQPERLIDLTVAIDKLDKIGLDNVQQELRDKGLPEEAIERLHPLLTFQGTDSEKLRTITRVLHDSEIGLRGIEETTELLRLYTDSLAVRSAATTDAFRIEFDLTLARGLNYYTGAIFEVKALDVEIGSITGGGRYDNLTGIFGMPGVSGVGISFGADRIYDVLNQLDLYPDTDTEQTRVLFAHFDEAGRAACIAWADFLRDHGINCEVYPDLCKIKKQMNYADKRNIPFVALIGEEEMRNSTVMLKHMADGTQHPLTQQQLLQHLLPCRS